jgi:hypothetical protein
LFETADDVPPLLHPNLAEEWRRRRSTFSGESPVQVPSDNGLTEAAP